jgi:hypothetical protein
MIQILKNDELFFEVENTEENEQDLLRKANVRAELLTRDNDGEFTARVKPVETVEPA